MKRKYAVGSIDPIEELIGKQLASIGMDMIFSFHKQHGQFSAAATSKKCASNYIEEIFIEALDRKIS